MQTDNADMLRVRDKLGDCAGLRSILQLRKNAIRWIVIDHAKTYPPSHRSAHGRKAV